MRCAKAIAPASFGALLQLPKDQLRELAEKQPTLKAGLREYVMKKAGNKARVAGLLDIFSDDPPASGDAPSSAGAGAGTGTPKWGTSKRCGRNASGSPNEAWSATWRSMSTSSRPSIPKSASVPMDCWKLVLVCEFVFEPELAGWEAALREAEGMGVLSGRAAKSWSAWTRGIARAGCSRACGGGSRARGAGAEVASRY